MKKLLLIILVVSTKVSFAQNMILPGDKSIQTKWIKDETYDMKWFRVKDTLRMEMGSISTTVSLKDKKLYIVANIQMNRSTSAWVDSTIADIKTISPVYHSSRNAQREMALNFGQVVTGFYQDNMKKKTDNIQDTVTGKYFDSNIYTSLLAWLPLKAGYTAKLPIYDYNSSQKHGIVYITINSVIKGKYSNADNSLEDVFILDITDGIAESNNTYYISVKDRRVLKIIANFGPARFEMVRI